MARTILVGKAASGKDHLRKKFESRGFKYAVSYTTRPPRPGEIDGKDYIFISEEKFNEMIDRDEWYEWVAFNGWKYGTSKDQFFNDDLFIMTPTGTSHIKPEDRGDSFIIYLDMPIEKRRARLEARVMPGDSVERRIIADEEDFKDFNNYDIRITNDDF
jgi:guanylate kinase